VGRIQIDYTDGWKESRLLSRRGGCQRSTVRVLYFGPLFPANPVILIEKKRKEREKEEIGGVGGERLAGYT